MKQVALSPRTGALEILEVPVPRVRPGTVLVRNVVSAVSAGTERLVIDLAGKSLLAKARARPDLVREALNKIRRDGLRTTVREALLRFSRPVPLGYSSAGVVMDVAADVTGLRPGDRVACSGAEWAAHAEVVVVPEALCVPLPDSVPWEAGAFAMLGGIALHGNRRSGAGRDAVVAVLGLGLIGQLTVQLLRAGGCRVLGQDVDPARAALARDLGADAVAITPADARSAAASLSGGAGVQAVIITAATSSNVPVELAAALCRESGTVVMVGVTGMDLPRRPYWEKELSFLLSRSSLPADNAGFIAALAAKDVRVEPLITHRFPIERAHDAYALILGRRREPHLGVVLTYPERPAAVRTLNVRSMPAGGREGPVAVSSGGRAAVPVTIGVIGAGLFAQTVLLPALRRLPRVRLRTIATQTGLSARHAADRLSFERCTTEAGEVLDDPEIQAVIIATRHDLHARLAIDALRRGKHVLVEKPLALTAADVSAVLAAHAASSRILMVGFNRRFSPLARALKDFLGDARPLGFAYRVNAGEIPADHWIYDPAEGGGRWLGEGGHFIDVLQYLADADPVEVFARAGGPASGDRSRGGVAGTTLMVSLGFGNGSTASVVYADGADRAESRERLEVYGGGLAATLEDYRRLTLARAGRVRRIGRWEAALGHTEELQAWLAAVRGDTAVPVAPATYAANTLSCLAALDSLRAGQPVRLDVAAVMPRRVEGSGG